MGPIATHYFEWASFAGAYMRAAELPTRPDLFFYTCVFSHEARESLAWRVWWEDSRGVHVFIGDKFLGPVTVLTQATLQLLALGQFVADRGARLEWRVWDDGKGVGE